MANVRRDPGIYPLEHKDNLAKCRRWKVVLTVDYRQSSRVVRGTLTEAREAKRRFLAEIEKGVDLSKANMTFEEYALMWQKRRIDSGNYAPATLTSDQTALNKFLPLLGKKRLSKVSPTAISGALEKVRDVSARDGKRLSNAYLERLYTSLNTLFRDAVKDEAIARNPCERVEKPKRDTKPRKSLEPARYAALLTEALEGEPSSFNSMLVLAMGFGLRRGECLGLEWGDVNFERETVSVERSLDGRTGKTKEPKTEKSRRTIPAISGTMEYLRAAKDSQRQSLASLGIRQTEKTPVCANPTGGHIWHTTLYYQFQQYAKARELQIVFHELRHTYATMLCSNGVDIITAAKLMGHSDTEMLSKVYAHVLDENKRAAAAKLSGMIAKESGSQEVKTEAVLNDS